MIAPPKINQPPSFSRVTAIITGLLGASGLLVLFFFNPTTHGFYPVCQFHQWTGLNCPGCGATRSLYALLHGHISLAWRDNALFVFCLVFAAGRALWLAWRKLHQQPPVPWLTPWILWSWLCLTLAFGVIRNLPGFEWLAPV